MTTEGHLKDGLIFRASYAGNMRINMSRSACIWCLFLVYLGCINAAFQGNIDSNKPNVCGTQIDIKHNEQVNLYSKDSVANGNCQVVLQKVGKLPETCRFHYLCVNMTISDRTNCSATTTLVGMATDKANLTREIKCETAFINPWCTVSESLVVHVQEQSKENQGYNVQITAYSTCKKKATIGDNYIKDMFLIEDGEAAVNYNRLMGIVVGVSLASVFLVIFIITYLYYKLKTNNNKHKQEEKPQPRAQYTRKPAM